MDSLYCPKPLDQEEPFNLVQILREAAVPNQGFGQYNVSFYVRQHIFEKDHQGHRFSYISWDFFVKVKIEKFFKYLDSEGVTREI